MMHLTQPRSMKVRARSRPPAARRTLTPAPKSLIQLASTLNIGGLSAAIDAPKSNIPLIVCAIMASVTTGGTMYGFSLYGNALKHSLHFTQSELATISSSNFLAGLLSWGPGLVVDRFGERCSLITGGIGGATSLCLFWTIATKNLLIPRTWLVWSLCSLGLSMCMSVALVTGSVFKLIVSTCSPGTKGATVGAAKGYVGLGAGAYAILFEALGRQNGLDCLLMIACFNFLATAVPAILLLPYAVDTEPRVDDLTAAHFRTMYLGLTGLGALVVGQSVISLYQTDDELDGPDYVQFFLLWAVWMGPIWSLIIHPRSSILIPVVDEEKPMMKPLLIKSEQPSVIPVGGVEVVPQSGNSVVLPDPYQDVSKKTDELPTEAEVVLVAATTTTVTTPTEPRQYVLYEMLFTIEAWLLCWTCTILTGGGILMTNNMGQMAESLRLHNRVTPAALALFCAAQALSRVVTGATSDFCLAQFGWGRPTFLMMGSIAGALSHIVLAFATSEVPFVIGVALSGVAFGMLWPMVVLIVGDLFGTKHLGANYMFFDGFDSAVGSLLISSYLAERVYEQHVVKSRFDDDTTCYGEGCFQATHLIVAGLSASCIITCLCLSNTKLAKVAYVIPSITSVKRKA